MAYTKTTWLDRAVQFANRYLKSGETSAGVTLTADPGTVTQAGTPFNATNLNKIEQGIADAHDPTILLTNLKTVDGAGSSLDADLLDGMQPSSTATANSIVSRDASGNTSVFSLTASGAVDAVAGIKWNSAYIAQTRDNAGVLEFFTGGAWKPVGGIKNVQRGSTSMGSLSTVNVTIAAVNMSKTFIVIPENGGGTGNLSATLTTSTNMSISGATNTTVTWQIVESY